jgi:signal transduction histidine kinase
MKNRVRLDGLFIWICFVIPDLLFSAGIHAQDTWKVTIDSMFLAARHDTDRIRAWTDYANYYKFKRPDSAIYFGYKAVELAGKINFPAGKTEALRNITLAYRTMGDNAKAMQIALQGLKIAEKNRLLTDQGTFWQLMGYIYSDVKNFPKAIYFLKKSITAFEPRQVNNYLALTYSYLGITYMRMNQQDSALYYCKKGHYDTPKDQWVLFATHLNLAFAFEKSGMPDSALWHCRKCLLYNDEPTIVVRAVLTIAMIYRQTGLTDSSYIYANKALGLGMEYRYYAAIAEATDLLSSLLASSDLKKSLEYSRMTSIYKDSLSDMVNQTTIEDFISYDNRERQQEMETARAQYRSQLKMNAFIGSTGTLLVILLLLYRNNRVKARSERKIEQAYQKVEQAFVQLKSTQAQLIQSEKMASLGQLIAGIAHEINTPLGAIKASAGIMADSNARMQEQFPALFNKLNGEQMKLFFAMVERSSVNRRTPDSKEEREQKKQLTRLLTLKGIAEPDKVADTLADIGIVEDVDDFIPLLTLRDVQILPVLYHLALMTRNSHSIKLAVEKVGKIVFALKNYAHAGNAEQKTKADITDGIETILTIYQSRLKKGINVVRNYEPIPQIFCHPDELSQVWTNLVTNALDAMEGEGTLTIGVAQDVMPADGCPCIAVRFEDTGKGVPEDLKPKIFEAFYTTKPIGEGSGLGLYIVREIVTRHGGEISVSGSGGKGTVFTIYIPV